MAAAVGGGGGASVLRTPTGGLSMSWHFCGAMVSLKKTEAAPEGFLQEVKHDCKILSITDVEKTVNVIACWIQDEAGEEYEHGALSNHSSSHFGLFSSVAAGPGGRQRVSD